MVIEGETQFNDWKLMASQMDWNRRDYACDIKVRLSSDKPDAPFVTVGHFDIVMNQDFSGALLKEVSAVPGYQYTLQKGSKGAVSSDISISISKAP